MNAALEYRVEITPDAARARAGALERALWLQNERTYHRWRARMPWRPWLRIAGVLLSVAGVALSEWAWSRSRRGAELYLAFAAVFAAFGLIFALAPSIQPALRRATQRMMAPRARRLMEQVARRAPYLIEYALRDGVLSARVEKLRLALWLDLRTVRTAVAAPDFVCAFPRWPARMRVLYLPGSGAREGLLEALRSAGAEVLSLD